MVFAIFYFLEFQLKPHCYLLAALAYPPPAGGYLRRGGDGFPIFLTHCLFSFPVTTRNNPDIYAHQMQSPD